MVGNLSQISKEGKLSELGKTNENLIESSMCQEPKSIWMQHPITTTSHPSIM